jgi:hypothetical protein
MEEILYKSLIKWKENASWMERIKFFDICGAKCQRFKMGKRYELFWQTQIKFYIPWSIFKYV